MKSLKSVLLLFFLINPFLVGYSGEPVNGEIVKSEKRLDRNKPDLEKIFDLKKHAEYKDIIDQFGEPDAVVGRGFLIIEYHLPDGRKAVLNFGGGSKLEALYEVSKDGKKIRYIIEP